MPPILIHKKPQFRIAQETIDEKHRSLGGEDGFLGAPVEALGQCPDGTGFFRRYKKGMIYWSPRTDAHEIHGAILDRWSELGFERSFLGYPISDEMGDSETPGRLSHFQGGMIHWFPASGAHETTEQMTLRQVVQKRLLDKYDRIGQRHSPLGLPQDRQMSVARAGNNFVMNFRGGEVQIPVEGGDAIAIARIRVELWLVGIECQIRQESTDEVYGAVGVIVPGSNLSATEKFPDADKGTFEMGPDGLRIINLAKKLYDGPPMDIVLTASLIEHDSGDTSEVKKKIAEAVAKAAQALAGEVGIPAEVTSASSGWINDLSLGLVSAIAGILGIDDDPYPPQQLRLRWSELQGQQFVRRTTRRNDDPRTIDFTHSIILSGVDDGGDRGQYAIYFDVRQITEEERL